MSLYIQVKMICAMYVKYVYLQRTCTLLLIGALVDLVQLC